MLKRHPLLYFYILAFAITWSIWLPAVAATRDLLPFPVPLAIDGLAYFWGPPLAACIVLYANEGRAGVRALLGRLLAWRVGAGWYAFALLWRPAILLAVIALIAALGGGIPALDPWYLLVPLFLLHTLVRIVAHVGEEIGWRGYALPRLQARIGPLAASVLIGLLAGLWHLPAFFIAGHPQYGTPILPFIVWMVAIAIVFTWVYNHTGGSLLPVTLLHAAINGAGAVFPSLPLALDVGVTLIAALAIVAGDRRAFFARWCAT
jgi:membrane protease YdiL (CAAX protease family)